MPTTEDIQCWSTTAGTNASIDAGIGWAENQARASVNNSARGMMAAHAKHRNLNNGSITTGGSANAQTFTSPVGYGVVPTGLRALLKIGFTNSGSTTLNMDGIGAVTIKDQAGNNLDANALVAGRYADLHYNGTNWILMQSATVAPALDAMAYNGMQINGAMEVSQENGVAPILVTNNQFYIVDGWKVACGGTTPTVRAEQIVVAPIGFNRALQIRATVANAAPAATDYCAYIQHIEGYRISRLWWGLAQASPITLGFWVFSTITGTFSGTVRNGITANRSYAFTYVVNAVSTWEYKTVTIAGDTTGTWVTDNTAGMSITFTAMSGTTYLTAPNVWTAGNFLGATGTNNLVKNTTDLMVITGVVLLPGTGAPSAAQSSLITRPFDQELQTCKRYWEKVRIYNVSYSTSGTGVMGMAVRFPVEKRSAPTSTLVANAFSNATFLSTAANATEVQCIGSVTATGTYILDATFTCDARLP